MVRGALTFEPSLNLRLTAEGNAFATGVQHPILTPDGRRSQVTVSGDYRPNPTTGSTSLDASFDRITSVTGQSLSARVGLSMMVNEIRLLPSVRAQEDMPLRGPSSARGYLGLNAVVLPRPELGRLLGAVSARGTVESETSLRFSSASMFLSRPAGAGVRVEAGVAWNRGLGASWSLVISTSLRSLRSYSTVNSSGGHTTTSNYLQGSVLYNPVSRRIALTPGPSMQRAGVAGRVFLDANLNGRFDTGESLLPGVRVRVGMLNALSDSAGRYRVWDLTPYEPVLMTVDSTSLPSPLWVPTFASASLELGPNEFRTIDIPVAPGGVIEGSILRETPSGRSPLAGVTVVLTSLRSGARRTLVTFSDGGFYAIGIKPGQYRIEVPGPLLQRLGATSDPVTFNMEADPDGATVSNLDLVLRPADR